MVKGDVAVGRSAPPAGGSLTGVLRGFRDFRFLWFGTLATQAGQWVLQIALSWLVFDLTNSEFYVGLSGFAGGLPMLLFSIPVGIMIDRTDQRRLLIGCQAAMSVLAAALAVLVISDMVGTWHLLVAAFLNGIAMTVNNATRQTIVVSTVPRDELTRAIALTSAGQNGTRVISPSIAGVIIGLVGIGGAFVFQAGLITVALALSFMLSAEIAASASQARVRGKLLDGVSYIWDRQVLRDLVALAAIPTLCVFPYVQLLPVYARDILEIGPQGLGIMMASSGIGATVGAIIAAHAANFERKGMFMVLTTVGYGGVIVAFAFSQWVWLSLPLLVLAGITGSAYMSLNNSLLHLNVSDDVRGRVMGVYMLTWGLMPLGSLPMGILASEFGAPIAVASGALLASTLTAILAIRSPQLRAL